jgi:nuclear cap-binding protein subunit 1
MVSLLQSFTTVLDEFGVSHGRAKRAALCAAEGLMIVRPPFRLDILSLIFFNGRGAQS